MQTTSTHFEVVQITVNHHLHNGNPSNGKKSLVWKLLLITRWHTHFLYKPPFWVETSLPLKLICVWLTSSHSMVVDCSTTTKESYSRVNGSKQQLNSFIIYNLDSIARVNERKKEEKKSEINKNVKKCAAVPYAIWFQSSNQLSYWDC